MARNPFNKKADKAVKLLNQHGILLVFPVNNDPNPNSLWHCLHPRSPMKWEWDSDGDRRVAKLWHTRAELAQSSEVVYSKWYKGRATFFSKDCFKALLAGRLFRGNFVGRSALDTRRLESQLSPLARDLLSHLHDSSPLSTKQLKAAADLKGRANERRWNRALKELWTDGWIVGFGEVDDGAFPSLAIGATSLLFEDLWREAMELSLGEAATIFEETLDLKSKFWKELTQDRPLPLF